MMTDTPQPTQPEEVTVTPPSRPRLERSKDGRILAGVTAALGNRFDVNRWWFRIGLLVLIPFGGLGLLLYLVGWLLIPDEGHRDPALVEWLVRVDRNNATSWIGIGLVVLAGLLVLGWIGALDNGLVWATLLVIAGVLLYRGDIRIGDRGDGQPTEPPPTESPSPPPLAEEDHTETDAAIEGGAGAPPSITMEIEEAPAPPRRSSILGRVTVAIALIVVGGMAVGANAGWIDPSVADYVAAVLGVAGVGLLAGSLWGRSRGLIILGILLLPLLLIARVAPVTLGGDFGNETFRPDTVAELEDTYRLNAGSLRLDLRNLELGGQTVEIDTRVGAGEIVVQLPEGAGIDVTASVGIGELRVLDKVDDGFGLDRAVQLAGEGMILLDVDLGFGSARITQAGR